MRVGLSIAVVLCGTATSHAEELAPDLQRLATREGRYELRVGGQYELSNSSRFSDDTAPAALTFGGAYFPVADISIGIGGAVALLSSNAEGQELYANAMAFYRLPLIRAFAGLRAGYYRFEANGSDYTVSDHGTRFALDIGFRLAVPRPADAQVFVEPAVILSFIGSSSVHDENNSSYPAWTGAMTLGVAVPVTL